MHEALPTGTVTFLFTDVEGSTKLLHELGSERYGRALAEHRRVVRTAFARHGGVEVDTQGDAFFVAFPTAEGAVGAAADVTEALAAGPIRVRVGIHTGTPHLSGEGYVGEDVHLGARIAASGHGGQVLVSKVTAEQLEAELTALGEHRLKDFDAAVTILQLGSERFPPLRTISNTNLPRPASSFIGRDRELGEVTALLRDDARLVTLSGPGGSGKTRLALEAASELVPEFKAGVFWVGLAPLRDPELVTATIAQALGSQDGLAEHIGERELLLLLDNLEQVVAAAPELGRLLEACPNLKLVVTSRELLRVRGEVEYAVLPLGDNEAIELFCARAQLEPDETIAELCRRLDNLPLALELASARVRILSPEQLLERLSARLDLLKGGRDADPRQQTLRTTIEWSYDLLHDDEERLFARLAVFHGGCTLPAAEEVAEADLDTLQSLVDKSLLRHADERFWMLETIHEFARERLEAAGNARALGDAHADWYSGLAAAAELRGPEHATWLRRLRAEHANLREALAWLHSHGSPEHELRLAFNLAEYAYHGGTLAEGCRWMDRALARVKSCPDDVQALGLAGGAMNAAFEGDLATAVARAEKAVPLARGCEPAVLAEALRGLALVRQLEGRDSAAEYAEALELARAHGLESLRADITNNLGYDALRTGDPGRAREFLTESVATGRRRKDAIILSIALSNLALAELMDGRDAEAARCCVEALEIARTHSLGPASTAAGIVAAALMVRAGSHRRGACACGAVDELVRRGSESLHQVERELCEQALCTSREVLGHEAVEAAVAAGRADADRVIDDALAWLKEGAAPMSRPPE